MTIKKTMRMTIEQEQLIYEILSQLQDDNFSVEFDSWQGGYCCPLCGGEPVDARADFKHAPNCLLTLAKRLRETLNTSPEAP